MCGREAVKSMEYWRLHASRGKNVSAHAVSQTHMMHTGLAVCCLRAEGVLLVVLSQSPVQTLCRRPPCPEMASHIEGSIRRRICGGPMYSSNG